MTPESIKRAREIIATLVPKKWFYDQNAFIAAARTGWPETLDEVERLTRSMYDANIRIIELENLLDRVTQSLVE